MTEFERAIFLLKFAAASMESLGQETFTRDQVGDYLRFIAASLNEDNEANPKDGEVLTTLIDHMGQSSRYYRQIQAGEGGFTGDHISDVLNDYIREATEGRRKL